MLEDGERMRVRLKDVWRRYNQLYKEANILTERSFKKLFILLYTTIVPFTILDILTTYYAVCMLGAIELNPLALALARFGFIGVALFALGFMALLSGLIAYFIIHSGQLFKIIFVTIFSIVLINYATTLLVNINTISYKTYAKPILQEHQVLKIVQIPPQQIEKIAQNFEVVREDFCRLL